MNSRDKSKITPLLFWLTKLIPADRLSETIRTDQLH